MITKDQAIKALSSVKDPDTGKAALLYGLIKSINIHPDGVQVLISLPNPTPDRIQRITKDVQDALSTIPDVGTIKVEVTPKVDVQPVISKEATIKNVIAVASGKGGVGKSTVAVNLAFVIARMGYRVGLLDADIYGASAHLMLGQGEPPLVQSNRIVPAVQHGVKFVSMGFFSRSDTPVIWRGPLVGKAVRDFVEITDWGELDYLIVDLPPGCLAAGTKVLMADNSLKPIEKIEAGEYVMSYDGHYLVPGRVIGVFGQGRRIVNEFKTSSKTILATPNHPFLMAGTESNWKSLDMIKEGEKVLVLSGRIKEKSDEYHATGKYAGNISSFNIESVKRIALHLRRYLEQEGKVSNKSASADNMQFASKYMINNRLPEWLFFLPAEHKIFLLQSLGESFRKGIEEQAGSKGNSLILQVEQITVIRGRNRALIEELQKLSRTAGVKTSEVRATFVKDRASDEKFEQYEFEFSRERDGVEAEEAISIRKIGSKETYDLQVEVYQNFVANGFIVHNTGDAPLTLAQTLKLSGIVLVTTPQEAAVQVAMKAYYMFKKLDIPIIGVIENMSYFVCPKCGEKTKIFGQGGGRKIAERLGVPFIGEIPLLPEISQAGDAGYPPYDDKSEAALAMRKVAESVIRLLGNASSSSHNQ